MDGYVKKLVLDLDIKDAINTLEKEVPQKLGKATLTKLSDSFTKTIKFATKSFTDALTGAFSNAMDEMKSLLQFSKLSNAQTRELMFGYGFTNAQAYGFNKAMQMSGFQSEEDLFYASSQEIKLFREAFSKYTEKYNELYDSGFFKSMIEYNFEMQDFKNELSLEVVRFVTENKGLIKNGMVALMDISKAVMGILQFFTNALYNSSDVATASDIVKSYSQTTKNSNVSISNSFNGQTSDSMNNIINGNNMNYKSLIKMFGGEI